MCAPSHGRREGPHRGPLLRLFLSQRVPSRHSRSSESPLLRSCFFSSSRSPRTGQQDLIVGIQVHGNRRIPAETVKARIFTKVGDVYDVSALERDFNALWNTGYFEDIRFEREQSARGWVLHIYVKERPTIREINYSG